MIVRKEKRRVRQASFAFFRVAVEPSFIRDSLVDWQPDSETDELSVKMKEKIDEIKEQEMENEVTYLEQWTRPIDHLSYMDFMQNTFPATNRETKGRVRKLKEGITELNDGIADIYDFYAAT